MPEFMIEVTSKSTFGPYNYATSAKLRNAIVAGELKMDELEAEDLGPVVFKVKAVKEKEQS
jgi:hypothetical protein